MRSEPAYDIIVVGAGHAGCEAAHAAARLGCRTLLLTHNIDTTALMSCNPAVGGVGKGQLVRELDALGGLMARLTDRAGIHFRRLNTSRGRAVRSSRAQVDRRLYRELMRQELEQTPNLELWQAAAARLVTRGRVVTGLITETGERLFARAVVLAPGTFLNGLVHIGLRQFPAGRLTESPSIELARSLTELGFRLGRFKTGTPPRLDLRSLYLDRLVAQPGDPEPLPFSNWTKQAPRNLVNCYITHTTPCTHRIVRSGLKHSPLYTGVITGRGVRYCPSIEDKVVKFADREQHQVFIEPEGTTTCECYPNGISTSLPVGLQEKMVHSIPGLEKALLLRPGYAVEHDYVDPTQLMPTLETRLIRNLYFCGQINGTTGYEEAAVQGLVAGANAGLRVLNREPLTLSRADGYIGVLIDDLVTRGTDEPYRMFTARVEYRLLLREDNADIRLAPVARRLGLLTEEQLLRVSKKQALYELARSWLERTRIRPTAAVNRRLTSLGTSPLRQAVPALELLRRPEIGWEELSQLADAGLDLPRPVRELVEVEVKYQGYIEREQLHVCRFNELEQIRIPERLNYAEVPGLSTEVRERLSQARPVSVGQARRIPGITPVAVFALLVHLKGRHR